MANKSTPTKSNKWIPNLSGRVDPQTDEAIRYLFQAVYSLRDGTGFGPDAKKVLTSIVQPLTINQILDKAQVALSGGGSHPIDITGSPGVTGQPQPSSIPTVIVLPPLGDPLSYIGSTVIFQGIEYQYRNIPGGGQDWVRSVSVGAALNSDLANFRTDFPAANYPPGTSCRLAEGVTFIVQDVGGTHHWFYYSGYQADLLVNIPTASLTVDDAGYTFSATDYIQQYQWAGTQFHFQTNSGSGYLQLFPPTSPPTYGLWGLCDGSTYDISQDDGTTAPFTTTTIPDTYIRR